MANSIFGIFKDKVLPHVQTDEANESLKSKSSSFTPPVTVGQAETAFEHLNRQLVTQYAAPNQANQANQSIAVKNLTDEDQTQKTVTDFLREIVKTQPFDIKTEGQKSVSVVLKTAKPPTQMSVADYQAAKWRAAFDRAGYALLTDEEIGLAMQAMKNNGWTFTDSGYDIKSLRAADAQPGPLVVKIDGTTMAEIKRAGQAVLQYQEYKAKGVDAAISSGNDYVSGALGGFVEKPYNAVVNNVNGLTEPLRAGERRIFGTSYLPELPRSTIGERSEYWQQTRNGITLNQMGEGVTTLQVGLMTGRPLYNTRIGALLGVQVGVYNIGVGASGTDPLHPDRQLSNLERGTRLIGGTMGVVSAPLSPGGRALSSSTFNTFDKLDDVFKTPPI